MNKQEEVRTKINELILSKGIKAIFIADKCGIPASLLSRFRKGQRDLWDETLDVLEKFIEAY